MKTFVLVGLAVAGAVLVYRRLGPWLDKLSARGITLAVAAALIMGAGAAVSVIIGLIAYALST